ncbi:MAG: secretin N-terminal domain-containing protein [Armatimonadota bacterium]|nr:secretin N-terminal domain-containing protein [Armatimonadota bacterium]
MRKGIGSALLAALLTGSLYLTSWGSDDYLVTIDLIDADFIAAVKGIALQAKVEVVFEPTDEPYRRISFISIRERPFEQVLRYLCQSAGATYRKEANGVYVISPLRATKPVETPPAAAPAPPERQRPVIVVESIPLRYSRASDIVRIIKTEMMTDDPFAEIRDFVNRTIQQSAPGMQVPVPPSVPLRVDGNPAIPYNNAPVSTPAVPTPQEFGEGQRGRGGFGGQFGGGQPGGGFGGQFGGGQPGGVGQPGAQAGILIPEGLDGIVANDIDNSLIVRGTPEAIEYIRRILRFLDIAPKQVLIRAEFITVSRRDTEKFGINWSLSRVNLQAGADRQADLGAPIFVNYATGNLVANLRAQLEQTRGRVVNAPVVVTQNNSPAVVAFTTTDYIEQQFVVFNQAGQPTTFTQPVPIPIPTQLTVTPRVNADGTITLTLFPQISTAGRVRVGARDLPRFETQFVFTVRRIRSGETMVLGGLITRSDNNVVTKVPLLSDLPVVGQFFRARTREVTESELLIFVTATVLEEDEGMGRGTLSP